MEERQLRGLSATLGWELIRGEASWRDSRDSQRAYSSSKGSRDLESGPGQMAVGLAHTIRRLEIQVQLSPVSVPQV